MKQSFWLKIIGRNLAALALLIHFSIPAHCAFGDSLSYSDPNNNDSGWSSSSQGGLWGGSQYQVGNSNGLGSIDAPSPTDDAFGTRAGDPRATGDVNEQWSGFSTQDSLGVNQGAYAISVAYGNANNLIPNAPGNEVQILTEANNRAYNEGMMLTGASSPIANNSSSQTGQFTRDFISYMNSYSSNDPNAADAFAKLGQAYSQFLDTGAFGLAYNQHFGGGSNSDGANNGGSSSYSGGAPAGGNYQAGNFSVNSSGGLWGGSQYQVGNSNGLGSINAPSPTDDAFGTRAGDPRATGDVNEQWSGFSSQDSLGVSQGAYAFTNGAYGQINNQIQAAPGNEVQMLTEANNRAYNEVMMLTGASSPIANNSSAQTEQFTRDFISYMDSFSSNDPYAADAFARMGQAYGQFMDTGLFSLAYQQKFL